MAKSDRYRQLTTDEPETTTVDPRQQYTLDHPTTTLHDYTWSAPSQESRRVRRGGGGGRMSFGGGGIGGGGGGAAPDAGSWKGASDAAERLGKRLKELSENPPPLTPREGQTRPQPKEEPLEGGPRPWSGSSADYEQATAGGRGGEHDKVFGHRNSGTGNTGIKGDTRDSGPSPYL